MHHFRVLPVFFAYGFIALAAALSLNGRCRFVRCGHYVSAIPAIAAFFYSPTLWIFRIIYEYCAAARVLDLTGAQGLVATSCWQIKSI